MPNKYDPETATTIRPVRDHVQAASEQDVIRAAARGGMDPQGATGGSISELWVADFSHVGTLAGFCYVAFVDVYSAGSSGWRVSSSRYSSLVLDAPGQSGVP